MTVIGIDQSLTATGIVILDMAGTLLQHETYKPRTFGALRLIEIRNKFAEILSNHEPQQIVMEGISYGSVSHIGELGGLFWTLKVLFYESGIPVSVVAPMSLKKWVLGSGKGEKNEMMRAVYKKWGLELNEHECDAYGLARIGLAVQGRNGELAQYEKEVIKTVMKGTK